MKIVGLLMLIGFTLTTGHYAWALDTSVEVFLNGLCYNRLIEDYEFLDRTTMSAQSIQKYLEFRGSYLANYTQGGKSAAQIIWEAAMGISPDSQGTWNGIVIDETTGTINPIAILVTLQKEQSLIASSHPSQWAIDWAMGYGVGNQNYIGFSRQVGWGAWQLRYNFERAITDWAADYRLGETMEMTDATGVYSVTFTNQATASLYRYTPHVFDGNYNFWKIYHDWFYPVAQAKLKANESNIQLIGKLITYATADFFYLEESDRSSGIRVEKAGHGLSEDMKADVYGQISTNIYGERFVAAQTAVSNGSVIIEPLAINIRNLGGSDWHYDSSSGAGQQGVDQGIGLNNIGCKAKVYGCVLSVDATAKSFVLSDGSGTTKVIMLSVQLLPIANSFVWVVGTVSCELSLGIRKPVILGLNFTTY